MANILYLRPGYVRPETDLRRNVLNFISLDHQGHVICPVWGKREPGAGKIVIGRFTYHLCYSYHLPPGLAFIWDCLFALYWALYLHYRQRKFDAIISYGTNKTGLLALLIKYLTGAKLIAEIGGNPAAAYIVDQARPSLRVKIKHRLSIWLADFVLAGSNHAKLLYPGQLDAFPKRKNMPASIFHDFTAVSSMEPTGVDGKYILSLGGPWYLKGMDVLIKAFKLIKEEFPEYSLKIVGWADDPQFFENLRGTEERIHLLRAMKYPQALDTISSCSVFVLASRTEAMGKVLLEAMAHKKPVVASIVDGIPTYVKDGDTGLLFEKENVDKLAQALRRVLTEKEFASAIAARGFEKVHSSFSEEKYVAEFNKMIAAVSKSIASPN